jgi:hypothetical protein
MDLSKIFEIINYYINYLKYKILCSPKSRDYDVLDEDETIEYTFTRYKNNNNNNNSINNYNNIR